MHAILTDKKGRNLETKKTTACKTDELTHVYAGPPRLAASLTHRRACAPGPEHVGLGSGHGPLTRMARKLPNFADTWL